MSVYAQAGELVYPVLRVGDGEITAAPLSQAWWYILQHCSHSLRVSISPATLLRPMTSSQARASQVGTADLMLCWPCAGSSTRIPGARDPVSVTRITISLTKTLGTQNYIGVNTTSETQVVSTFSFIELSLKIITFRRGCEQNTAETCPYKGIKAVFGDFSTFDHIGNGKRLF